MGCVLAPFHNKRRTNRGQKENSPNTCGPGSPSPGGPGRPGRPLKPISPFGQTTDIISSMRKLPTDAQYLKRTLTKTHESQDAVVSMSYSDITLGPGKPIPSGPGSPGSPGRPGGPCGQSILFN